RVLFRSDQFELYNATADPAELANLYGNAAYADTQAVMAKLLQAQRDAKRLTPLQEPWADGSTQQFPFTPS
ncbi:MAG: Sulfatase-like hydrolase/transferase, partial [Actinomycetota bacterium]|nr:Sulfatase-like hydrolase/transferase [Actinomycetota bacterium]